MKLRIITDLHAGSLGYCNGELRRLGDHAERLIDEFIATVNEDQTTDAAFQLGDLIEDDNSETDLERYQNLIAKFSDVNKPIYHLAGNHDLNNINADDIAAATKRNELSFKVNIKGYSIICVATLLIDGIPLVSSKDYDFLKIALNEAKRPCIIISHHPFSEHDLTNNLGWYEKNIHRAHTSNRKDIRKLVNRSNKVICYLNGHLHANYYSVIDGIPFFTIQSATDKLEDDRPACSHAELFFDDEFIELKVHGNEPFYVKHRISLKP